MKLKIEPLERLDRLRPVVITFVLDEEPRGQFTEKLEDLRKGISVNVTVFGEKEDCFWPVSVHLKDEANTNDGFILVLGEDEAGSFNEGDTATLQ